ncbi:MAG: hypothetical protein ILM98_06560 [Kiritimatiellae bacterium]|nr:hypothetical protein [Kiritimatiellia bacterium]
MTPAKERTPPPIAAHRPVAGCVVDCSDDGTRFPPALFGAVPVVYLQPPPELRDGRVAYVATDNEAVARAAFRELSAGLPLASRRTATLTPLSRLHDYWASKVPVPDSPFPRWRGYICAAVSWHASTSSG